jgi:hypothetical protein
MPPNVPKTTAEQIRQELHMRATPLNKENTLSVASWSADPTFAPPWDHFPAPSGDDIWVRPTVLNLPYRVGKKCLMKHLLNPREPWCDVIRDHRLFQQLRTAALAACVGTLPDDQLRPFIDRWWACLDPRGRSSIEGEGLVMRCDWALADPGWERRLEPRWLLLLPGGVQMVLDSLNREMETVTIYIPKELIEFPADERLAVLASDMAEEYGERQRGRLVSPSPKREFRYPQPYGVEVRTRIRFLDLERWRQIVL